MLKRSTVVVDGENWYHLATRILTGHTIDDLLDALRQRYPGSRIVIFTSQLLPRDVIDSAATRVGAEVRAVEKGHYLDVEMAAYATELIPDVEELVLASADRAFLSVIKKAKTAGVVSVLLARPESTPIELIIAADTVVDVRMILKPIEGLISPGDAPSLAKLLSDAFMAANQEIVILDPYVGPETVRLLALAPTATRLLVVGQLIAGAREELRTLRAAGREISVIDNRKFHDRWFRIDGYWWHSGGSLKDIGNKFSRVSALTAKETAPHEQMLAQLMASGTPVRL